MMIINHEGVCAWHDVRIVFVTVAVNGLPEGTGLSSLEYC